MDGAENWEIYNREQLRDRDIYSESKIGSGSELTRTIAKTRVLRQDRPEWKWLLSKGSQSFGCTSHFKGLVFAEAEQWGRTVTRGSSGPQDLG
jgi:hypothetical protein